MGMRVLRNAINHFRLVKSNTTLVSAFFIVGLLSFGVIGVSQFTANAAIRRDCDNNAIMKCGFADVNEFRANYDKNAPGDLPAIYGHYWIPRNLQVVQGTSYKDGTVRVNGRIVAKNATSIGRQQLAGEHPISIAGRTYFEGPNNTSFATDALPTMVALDAQGNFKYAVLNGCGNPIYATPVPPPVVPPTPPAPKMIQVCDLTTNQVVNIKEADYNTTRYSKNLNDCKNINVCDLTTKQVVTIKLSQFNSTRYSKNLDDCKVPNKITVCDLTTKKIVSIDENMFDSSKYSKSLDDCQAKCTIPGKETLPANSKDCVVPVTPVSTTPTPPVLPETGPTNMIFGGVGISSIILSASLYMGSRRDLLSTLLNR